MHELGNLYVEGNEVFTKVNKNLRSYRVYNSIILIPLPDMFPALWFMGDNSVEISKPYTESLLLKEGCREVFEIHQNILIERGLSIDEVCTIMNFLINSPSLIGVPNILKVSDKGLRRVAKKLAGEGW